MYYHSGGGNRVKVAVRYSQVDILLNNAGIVSGKKLFDCPDELMERYVFYIHRHVEHDTFRF